MIHKPTHVRRVTMTFYFSNSLIVLALVQLLGDGIQAQDQQQQAKPDAYTIAAKVNGQPIYVRQVERQVKKILKDRKIEDHALKVLKAQALEQLIKRHLILSYLAKTKWAVSDQDIALALENAKTRLKQQDLTLDEFLRRARLSETEFRQTLNWQLGWRRYLDDFLSDQNLQKYFKKHQKHFDGTQVRVSQILIKVKPGADQVVWDEAAKKAAAIRQEITSGKVEFSAAAKAHSEAPSGAAGGSIGFISRHQPMPESFSRAAFDLDKGKVSQPVTSRYGVHLIQSVEIKHGQKRWQDSRKELETAVTRFLFDWVAKEGRKNNAVIRYTGESPHFKPGTKQLAN